MGIDIWVVRGRADRWHVYDRLEDWSRTLQSRLDRMRKEMAPECERARAQQLWNVACNALLRFDERYLLTFPPGWDDGYLCHWSQISGTPLRSGWLLSSVISFSVDAGGPRYTREDWPAVFRESSSLLERCRAGEFSDWGEDACGDMIHFLNRVRSMALWIVDTQNPDEYRGFYSF